MELAPFVNREHELRLINEAFDALLKKEHMLRTPILEFQGVGGMGKTSLLRQVEARCHEEQLPCVWVDMSQSARSVTDMSRQIVTQVRQYAPIDTPTQETSPVPATKALLKQAPVVMLFDAIDAASTEQLRTLETWLRDLIDGDRLFVILAGKKGVTFEQERNVARKLTSLTLQSLDRDNCEDYFDQIDSQIEREVRDIIFAWTRGYPLAMNVMAGEVSAGLDPRTEQGRQKMLAILKKRVIEEELLGNVSREQRAYFLSALQLFSLPRRFNLSLMQDLINTFAPDLKRESSLAYISLPREINEATSVLKWDMARAGFSVDSPIRALFLLIARSEEPERYFAIHDFLAQTNLRLASAVSGSDRMRCIREALYHIACNTSNANRLQLMMDTIAKVSSENPDAKLQFSEEFSQDDELKEALGSHLGVVQAFIDEWPGRKG